MTLEKSLKVIQDGTIQKVGCVFLIAFHSNYGHIFKEFTSWKSDSQDFRMCTARYRTELQWYFLW